MKIVSLISLMFLGGYLYAAHDTTKIVFFLDSNIQQYKGLEWHRMMQKIPRGNYKKAILQIDLGCATYGCCAWDYTYRGFFSKKINDTTYEDIEVARLITPYSSFMRRGKNGYDSTWEHPYRYDVTDYLSWIQDSLIYSAHTGGWDNKGHFGFKHTVTLYLIKGDQPQTSSSVIPIYQNAYRYLDSFQFDTLTKGYHLRWTPEDRYAKFRMIFTGHDQQGEFSPVRFYLRVNGQNVFQKRLWKTDCDQNAIQPQSGTWIFSRCNWCPGEKVKEVEVDISTYMKLGDNEIDIALGKPETKDSLIQANYLIEGDIIRFNKKPACDVALLDIVAPSSDPNYKLFNPICRSPKVKIKNMGHRDIDQAIISYWVENGKPEEYVWTGHIRPYQDTIVSLGNMDFRAIKTGSPFYTSLKQSKNDIAICPDTLVSRVNHSDIFYTDKLVLEVSTSNDSSTNSLQIFSLEKGNIIHSNSFFNNAKTYRDTIHVHTGCHELTFTDYDKNYECGDGLSFWYSSMVEKKVSGIFKIYDGHSGRLLKVFNPDFGGKITYQFRIEKDINEKKGY